MKSSADPIDQSCDFLLTEDRWDATLLFGIGSFRNTPGFFESLGVEEPQSREAVAITVPGDNFRFSNSSAWYSRMCRGPKRSGGQLNRRAKSSTVRM